jgi:V-type H+-transporting ATPase subunit a
VCVCVQMFMEIGDVPVAGQTVSGQGSLQMFLIFIAFVSVPCLLFPKPYLLKWEHEKNQVSQQKKWSGSNNRTLLTRTSSLV